jgi:large subunit ribosomal protein L32
MAVPKRKTSKSRKNLRRSHHALAPPAQAKCAQCGEPRAPHRICRACGHYDGTQRIEIKDEE